MSTTAVASTKEYPDCAGATVKSLVGPTEAAVALTEGCPVFSAKIASPGEVDAFAFDATEGQRVSIRLSGENYSYVRISLVGPDDAVVPFDSQEFTDAVGTVRASGRNTVKVAGVGARTFSYRLRLADVTTPITVVRPVTAERACPTPTPSIVALSPDTEVTLGDGCSVLSGKIAMPGETDDFSFDAVQGSKVSFRLDGENYRYVKLSLWGPDGLLVPFDDKQFNEGVGTLRTAGRHVFRVEGSGSRTFAYNLRLSSV